MASHIILNPDVRGFIASARQSLEWAAKARIQANAAWERLELREALDSLTKAHGRASRKTSGEPRQTRALLMSLRNMIRTRLRSVEVA